MKGSPERPNWSGQTVACLASGPSLTAADCELVRSAGLPTIVTNTTFRLAPWADVLYAMDTKWWKEHHVEVQGFKGRKVSPTHAAKSWGAESLYGAPWLVMGMNSGAGAIGLAISGNAKQVVLLGYDCQKTDGKVHWHGNHSGGLGNGASMKQWPKQFRQMARQAQSAGVPIVNCTRQTALNCFPVRALEDVLSA